MCAGFKKAVRYIGPDSPWGGGIALTLFTVGLIIFTLCIILPFVRIDWVKFQ